MLPFQIKICGVTNVDDARCVCRSGADAIGLNFFKRSPRFLDEQSVGVVVDAIDSFNAQVSQSAAVDAPIQDQIGGTRVKKIGVFVNTSPSKMVETAKSLNLDAIQLHGDESPPIIGAVRSRLKNRGFSCLLIRAIRSSSATSDENQATTESSRLAKNIEAWTAGGIDAILLDAAVPGEFGGTGKVVDWKSIPALKCKIPLVLAGGLNPRNVRQAILSSGVQSVDVASGVESVAGTKDPDKIKAFVSAARRQLGFRN